MYFEKRYLQFNDLVFDGYDMISDYDEPLQFKGTSTAYSYGHGSYAPFKNDYLYVSERQVNMTITLKMKKLPCEFRESYLRFAIQELSKPGKLWAIRGNEILWANARVNNIRPVNNGKKNRVVFDIEFVVPGGVWHKADKQRTFLLPYEVCSYMSECRQMESYNPCISSKGGGDCCEACQDNKMFESQRDLCGCCCDDVITADMSLCYHQGDLQAFYGCDVPYQLVYSCEKALEFSTNDVLGQQFCAKGTCDKAVISGQVYSDTDIPTEEMTITIVGNAENPWITINGNTNIIEGSYNGKLIIEASGDVYYQSSPFCEPELLDPSVWTVPADMKYGWTIHPQQNRLTVYMNTCCSQGVLSCVYIDHTAITI